MKLSIAKQNKLINSTLISNSVAVAFIKINYKKITVKRYQLNDKYVLYRPNHYRHDTMQL